MDAADRIALLEADNARLRERVATLEDQLGMSVEASLALGLTPKEAQLFGLLLARDTITKEQALANIYGLRPDGDEPEIKIIDVFICKIRRKLRRFGVEITTHWGAGYSLDAENKARARALMGVTT
jgi:two-component system, cell cycle response regulator CtrA